MGAKNKKAPWKNFRGADCDRQDAGAPNENPLI